MWLHIKKITSFLATILLIGPISLLINSCVVSPDVINVEGSSSMYALFQDFSNNYQNADITVRASGSAAGIESVLDNKSDFGNVSHSLEEQYANPNWKSLNIKTITVGWDPIVVLYKKTSNANDKLYLTKDNFINLYGLFSGFETVSYSNFGGVSTESIHAFARIGGAANSGTADAFMGNSGFITKKQLLKDKACYYNALMLGSYNENGYVSSTGEPNVQAYQAMVNSNKKYVMSYFSAGFVYTNWKIIGKDYDILGYLPKDKTGKENIIFPSDSKYVNTPTNLITDGYQWFRPFNTIFRLMDKEKLANLSLRDKKMLNFAFFLATGKIHNFSNSSDTKVSWYESVLKESGVIELSDIEKQQMFKDSDSKLTFNNFLCSDYELGHAGVNGENDSNNHSMY